MSSNKGQKLDRIKTGSFERRLRITTAGLLAGTRLTTEYASSLLTSKSNREERRKKALSKQAQYLAEELGKLKGSVVKVGQMMALFGEHFLPNEVTEALHTLENKTSALHWEVIEQTLKKELKLVNYFQLDIEDSPLGAASLGQVHQAQHKADEIPLCIKVQYPGVAEAIDADLNAIAQLLKITKIIRTGEEFEEWLTAVRLMLHQEVDYIQEADTTERFKNHLKDDNRFIVPEVIREYSNPRVLTTTFEAGHEVTHKTVQQLPQARRNAIGKASLDLFLKEVFIWGEIQTDPNFGNYRIRISEDPNQADQIVLLDFGAVMKYDKNFLSSLRGMILGAYYCERAPIITGAIELGFMSDTHCQEELNSFADMCMLLMEPFAKDPEKLPEEAVNNNGEYCWQSSQLPKRVATIAAKSAFSKHFNIPPKEFVFLNRKLIGVYTFISVLGAEFNGRDLIQAYL